MNAKDIIKAYDALVGRAIEVVGLPPYISHVWNREFARLSMNGDSAFLRWPEVDDDNIEDTFQKFPAELLLMTDEEFDAWVAQKEEERRIESARINETNLQIREHQEREMLAKLKAKYEGE